MDEPPTDGIGSDEKERVDAVLSALADRHRRRVLRYFQASGETVATIDDLVEFAVERGESGEERGRLEATYYHTTLPHLAEAGFLEFDARSRTARFREFEGLERAMVIAEGTTVIR